MTRPTTRAAALLLLVAVALAACGTSGPTPSPVATAPATAGPGATPAPCGRVDVMATSDGWGAAAGSRGADVTVENVGSNACVLPPVPTAAFLDATAAAILQTPPRIGGMPLTLEPGGSATFSLVASNWCGLAALPVAVVVALAADTVPIAGLPIESADDLPPCMGEGQPSTLTTTDWQPAS
jgi:predicted small lipoprotein YifL